MVVKKDLVQTLAVIATIAMGVAVALGDHVFVSDYLVPTYLLFICFALMAYSSAHRLKCLGCSILFAAVIVLSVAPVGAPSTFAPWSRFLEIVLGALIAYVLFQSLTSGTSNHAT